MARDLIPPEPELQCSSSTIPIITHNGQDCYGPKSPQANIAEEAAHHAEQGPALLKAITRRVARSPLALWTEPATSTIGNLIPGADKCVILLLDVTTRRLRPEVAVNLPQEFIPALYYNEQKTWLLTTAAEGAQPYLIIHLPGNRQFSPLCRLAYRENIRTLWLIPLRAQDGRLLGAILFGSEKDFSPNQQAVASARILTEWISMVLQEAHAQQHNQIRKAATDYLSKAMSATGDPTHADQKSQSGSDIISVLAHELLSPLTLIKGYTATLLRLSEAITEEQKRQYLQGTELAANKLTKSLENLRDLSWLEAGIPNLVIQSTSLPQLLRKTISEIQIQTTKHIIKLRQVQPLPRLNLDQRQIEHVMSNILVNAVKYSPRGGNVQVTVRQLRDKNELKKISAKLPLLQLPCVLVTVTDPGIGIPEEELELVFQKFYRVRNRLQRVTSGVGLGLYICKFIIEAHGGHIWARSQAGEGSAISFTLPVN